MTLTDRFTRNAEAAGCTVHRRGTQPSAPELPALFGLADTGSVVFAASAERPRAAWLEPEVLLVRLPEERILADLEELFATLGPELPSALAIVTGPSRTADIEQTLAVGVHGPRELHVLVD
jgi:L-lactate dehydrogenase complex protein LldG